LTLLALSLLEKSITVQTKKQLNKITNSNRYISTPCLSACVDNKKAAGIEAIQEEYLTAQLTGITKCAVLTFFFVTAQQCARRKTTS